jgi:hypothetical protein
MLDNQLMAGYTSTPILLPIKDLNAIKSVAYDAASNSIIITNNSGVTNSINLTAELISFSNSGMDGFTAYKEGVAEFIYEPTHTTLTSSDLTIESTSTDVYNQFDLSCKSYVDTAIANALTASQI